MLQMGFSLEEIQDSLVNQKYNDVMAAYLLLDYRNSEVTNSHHALEMNKDEVFIVRPSACLNFEDACCAGDLFSPSFVPETPLELHSDHRFVFLPSVGGRLHQA